MKPILQGWLASSTDPSEVSARIKGLLVAASAAIIFIAAQIFHITISPTDYLTAATEISVIGGAIWSLYGLLRAGAVKVGSRR